ncbi:Annexin [Spironucleus salmonicida]|uniref:Annexin n=1 Tax=Spironucleus salmonicida TaxID=348837 RepID=V6LJW5_9EUKA|nr:Annexin [Spironucleus salmonicida]|eukprot:EST44827.1 Annexin [Spironucleus salmonicida]
MNIHALARDVKNYLQPPNPLAIFKIIMPLSHSQVQQLCRAFQQQTGYCLKRLLTGPKFGFLCISGSTEINSLESVYERACAVAALEATSSETFVLTPPAQQLGQLLSFKLDTEVNSLLKAILQAQNDAISLVEIIFSASTKMLISISELINIRYKQTPIQLLSQSFGDQSDAKFLIVSRFSALFSEPEVQKMSQLTNILHASMNSYISKIPLMQLFARLLLLIDQDQLAGLVNLTNQSEDLIDLQSLIEKKFQKEAELVEYAFLIYIDCAINQKRGFARILRRGIKENRDFSICWVLSQRGLQDVKQQYKEMFGKDCMKELKSQSCGIFKKAITIL